jgi:hypothetical protein
MRSMVMVAVTPHRKHKPRSGGHGLEVCLGEDSGHRPQAAGWLSGTVSREPETPPEYVRAARRGDGARVNGTVERAGWRCPGHGAAEPCGSA